MDFPLVKSLGKKSSQIETVTEHRGKHLNFEQTVPRRTKGGRGEANNDTTETHTVKSRFNEPIFLGQTCLTIELLLILSTIKWL